MIQCVTCQKEFFWLTYPSQCLNCFAKFDRRREAARALARFM